MSNPNIVWTPLAAPSYYLSGPMTGLPDFNYPYFNTVAAALRLKGFSIVNPAELNDSTVPFEQCLRADIKALCDCDGIILLAGWENSKGANLELHLAHRLGIKVYPSLDSFLKEHNHDPL